MSTMLDFLGPVDLRYFSYSAFVMKNRLEEAMKCRVFETGYVPAPVLFEANRLFDLVVEHLHSDDEQKRLSTRGCFLLARDMVIGMDDTLSSEEVRTTLDRLAATVRSLRGIKLVTNADLLSFKELAAFFDRLHQAASNQRYLEAVQGDVDKLQGDMDFEEGYKDRTSGSEFRAHSKKYLDGYRLGEEVQGLREKNDANPIVQIMRKEAASRRK